MATEQVEQLESCGSTQLTLLGWFNQLEKTVSCYLAPPFLGRANLHLIMWIPLRLASVQVPKIFLQWNYERTVSLQPNNLKVWIHVLVASLPRGNATYIFSKGQPFITSHKGRHPESLLSSCRFGYWLYRSNWTQKQLNKIEVVNPRII